MNFRKLALSAALLTSVSLTVVSCGPKDEDIKKSVDEKLATAPGVTATVEKGVVTLNGEYADSATRAKIASDVQTVKGVKSVTDNSSVTPPPPPVQINPDAELMTAIQNGFTSKGFSGITVTALNGEVTLTGEAKRSDLQTIMQIANESKPKKVVNKLTLK